MKIAVVGAGISGLVCAYLLSGVHEVTLYERDDRLGGHTNTVIVAHEGRSIPVDTGFIVFNDRNYPNFCALLRRLGVASRPTTMSFSVRDERGGFEYGGSSLGGAIGLWSNLLRPRWWRVMAGVATLGRKGFAFPSAGRTGFFSQFAPRTASAGWRKPPSNVRFTTSGNTRRRRGW